MNQGLILRRRGVHVHWAQQIMDLAWDFRAARTLLVAHRTGVFDRLAQSAASTATLAAELKLDADLLERVLIACAAMHLLRRDQDRWKLTPKAKATLDPQSPYYQGNVLGHMAGVWDFWNDLEHHLRGQQGASTFSPQATRARNHRDFILAMHNMSVAGRAAELASRIDLTGRKTLIDVGGGPGTYSIAFCQKYPDLHATIFDLPPTVAIAREVIERFNLSDRITTAEGSWDTHEFGQGCDALLLSNVLHGPSSDADMKLQKARRALNPGGMLIVQDFVLNSHKTGPLLPALFNIMVGAYSLHEIIDRIAAAGFSQIHHQPMPPSVGTTLLTAVR